MFYLCGQCKRVSNVPLRPLVYICTLLIGSRRSLAGRDQFAVWIAAFKCKVTKFHIVEKKKKSKRKRGAQRALYFKWRRREGGLSKVFETDEGGGSRGVEGGGGREG